MTKRLTKNIKLNRRFFHWVIRKLVDNIEEYRHGFHYICPDGVSRWLVPVISFVITDWPEGQAMTMVGGSATGSNTNCRFCLQPTRMMGSTEEGDCYQRRTQIGSMALGKEYRYVAETEKKRKEVLEMHV